MNGLKYQPFIPLVRYIINIIRFWIYLQYINPLMFVMHTVATCAKCQNVPMTTVVIFSVMSANSPFCYFILLLFHFWKPHHKLQLFSLKNDTKLNTLPCTVTSQYTMEIKFDQVICAWPKTLVAPKIGKVCQKVKGSSCLQSVTR